jgi:hypothetical protein
MIKPTYTFRSIVFLSTLLVLILALRVNAMALEPDSGIIKIKSIEKKETNTLIYQKKKSTWNNFILLRTRKGLPAILTETSNAKEVGIFIPGGVSTGWETVIINKEAYSFDGAKSADRFSDSFPITLKYSIEDDAYDPIEGYITADLDGDGNSELIFWQRSNVKVYTQKKLLFSHKWALPRKLANYSIEDATTVRFRGKDIVICAVRRHPWDYPDKYDKKTRHYFETTSNDSCLIISDRQILTLYIKDLPGDIRSVLPLSKKGSEGINWLIVLSRVKVSDLNHEIRVSRHDLKGNMLNSPRALPDIEDLLPLGIPDSLDVLAVREGAYEDYMPAFYFTPGVNANWYRKIFSPGHTFKGLMKYKTDHLVLSLYKSKLYAVDKKGLYYKWIKETLIPEKDQVPLCLLPVKGKDYSLSVLPINADNSSPDTRWINGKNLIITTLPPQTGACRFLMVQTRKTGLKSLSDEEIINTGKRFLTKEYFSDYHSLWTLAWGDYRNHELRQYCKKNKIPVPQIESLEDIKNKLPGFYNHLIKNSDDDYVRYVKQELIKPLNYNLSHITDPKDRFYRWEQIDKNKYYKNKKDYKSWLRSVNIPAETIFSVVDSRGSVLSSTTIAGYYNYNSQISYVFYKGYNLCFVPLYKKLITDTCDKPGLYLIYWK